MSPDATRPEDATPGRPRRKRRSTRPRRPVEPPSRATAGEGGRAERVRTLLVLFRHGPSETRDPRRWPNDDERPLSKKGVRETRRAAVGLARLLPPRLTLATSPAVRARDTALMLRRALGSDPALTYWKVLAPGSLVPEVFRQVARHLRRGKLLALVGHEPTQTELVSYALTGEAVPLVHLSKAGAVAVEFPGRVVAGGGRLRWLLTRRQLARLRR